MHEEQIRNLMKCPLFAGMENTGIDLMIQCFRPRLTSFRKGEYIAIEGQPQDTVGVVLAGKLNVLRESIGGSKLILASVGPGELFGEMAAFSGIYKWTASILAVEVAETIFIPIEKFSSHCSKSCANHPLLIKNMLGIISRKALLLNRKIEYLTIKGMREKLCRYLAELSRQKGSESFNMDMSRNELADFLNVSRPSMSRELGRMRDEGMIEFSRGSISILQVEKLREYCPEFN